MHVTLYHFPPSFYSQIVRLALAEKRIDWQSRFINIRPALENYKPWYMGERYTLADAVWTVFLARIKLHGESLRYKDKQYVADYYRRLKQRPSFKQADIWEHIKPLALLPVILRYFFTIK